MRRSARKSILKLLLHNVAGANTARSFHHGPVSQTSPLPKNSNLQPLVVPLWNVSWFGSSSLLDSIIELDPHINVTI